MLNLIFNLTFFLINNFLLISRYVQPNFPKKKGEVENENKSLT